MQMTQEISIHRSVSHKHIVGFHGFFEDNDNVYILLELCRRRVSSFFKAGFKPNKFFSDFVPRKLRNDLFAIVSPVSNFPSNFLKFVCA